MICENCNIEYKNKYGSGRFCCSKCARSFSTKFKRKEINEKVSKALSKKQILECKVCGTFYYTKSKFCSRKCLYDSGFYQSEVFKSSIGKPDCSKNGGYREGGGRCKVYEYISDIAGSMKLNVDEIELAKIFDLLKLNWKRNTGGFEYYDLNNKKRKYHPDFYLIDHNLFVEYKGWVTKEMSHKMNDATIRNNLNLLIIYSNDKRYKNLGLNLKSLKENPNLLFEYINMYTLS